MKSTADLDRELSQIHSVEELEKFFKDNLATTSLGDCLYELLEAKRITVSNLDLKTSLFARVSDKTIYAIMNGRRNPSKNLLIRIGFGLNATVDELNTLLKHAGLKELYSKKRADSIIIFGLQNKMEPAAVQNLLDTHNITEYKIYDPKEN